MLEEKCKAEGRIAVASNEAVDARDYIEIIDTETSEIIWKKDYYSFRLDPVYNEILAHFAKKSAEEK